MSKEKKELKEEDLNKVVGGTINALGKSIRFKCNDCEHTWRGSFLTAKCPECKSKNISKME